MECVGGIYAPHARGIHDWGNQELAATLIYDGQRGIYSDQHVQEAQLPAIGWGGHILSSPDFGLYLSTRTTETAQQYQG